MRRSISEAAGYTGQPRQPLSGSEKQQALIDAILEHYQQLYQRAQRLRGALPSTVQIIATDYLMTVGVSTTDSVRAIYIGALDAFTRGYFCLRIMSPWVISTGHRIINGNDRIRYRGSSIPLSFDEASQPKRVNLVTFRTACYR